MKKHGASHGIAVLVCTVSAALMADVVRNHNPLIHNSIRRFSEFIAGFLPIPYDPKYIGIVLFAALLATIWGIAFTFVHND